MSVTHSYTEVLVTEHCYSCGIAFAMPTDFKDQRLSDRKDFYCPNGHGQHYMGKTDAQKLREAHEALEAERRRTRAVRDLLTQEERSHAATKGHVTRKARELADVKAGICPVQGCRRHFANLANHMANQHPGFTP